VAVLAYVAEIPATGAALALAIVEPKLGEPWQSLIFFPLFFGGWGAYFVRRRRARALATG
jgi:hypothetical protein